VPEPSAIEVEIAIEKLKRYKSPGTDQIPAEMIKAGGSKICSEIHKLINSIWNKEELPEQWEESITVHIYYHPTYNMSIPLKFVLISSKRDPVTFIFCLIIVFLILSFLEILAEHRQQSISVEFNVAIVFALKHHVSAAYVIVLSTTA
jgi:hypothetical protein